MKWDSAYALARRPDLIIINLGYFPKGHRLAEAAASDLALLVSHPMDVDLFRHVARDGSYRFQSIPFDDGSRFYVFERAP
jgi:hypothetical protein